MQNSQTIRLSLPAKGRLESDALDFLSAAGLQIFKPSPRQYEAKVPALPELGVFFQRPGEEMGEHKGLGLLQGKVVKFAEGLPMIAQKVGEAGTEVVVTALAQNDQRLIEEVADLTYHTRVLLSARGLTPAQIIAELKKHHE